MEGGNNLNGQLSPGLLEVVQRDDLWETEESRAGQREKMTHDEEPEASVDPAGNLEPS